MMEERTDVWTETDSRDFLDLAEVAVPGREEQIEMLLQLVPAAQDEEFQAVELACGEGILAERLLDRSNEMFVAVTNATAMMAGHVVSPPGTDVILVMLATGFVFLLTIALGELTHWAGHRRQARKRQARPY